MILNASQVHRILNAFSAINGMPLSDVWHIVGFEKFEFGEQKPFVNRRGEDSKRADWSLTVTCAWSLRGPDGFLLNQDSFDKEDPDQEKYADSFYDLLETNPPTVEDIHVKLDGGLIIDLSQGFVLEINPEIYEGDEDHIEEWRLMPPVEDPRGHLVLSSHELGWSDES